VLPSRKLHPCLRIPFKLLLTAFPNCFSGALKYGVPGCGQTSLIQYIAGELNLTIYIIPLSRAGLDDDGLQGLFSRLPARCIILIEDIDVALHRILNREPYKRQVPKETKNPKGSKTPQYRSARISLGGLLNALDGVGAKEGRLLFAIVSRYEALDPALRRPGRFDYLVEFKLASRYQVGELFKKFYLPTPRASPYKDPTTSKDRDTPEELDVLAERFRELIPEREISMDALQGYLMMHKNQPHRAVECAGKWVGEEMAQRGSG